MNAKNIEKIQSIASACSRAAVKYRFIDMRWKQRGDVDIIVAHDSIQRFEQILDMHGFTRKGLWPPQSRTYKAFLNDELLSIGAHVGGYCGGFGGGLGRLGKLFEPRTVMPAEKACLPLEEQLFVLLYKYASRAEPQKYEAAYHELVCKPVARDVLVRLCRLAFRNPAGIAADVIAKKPLPQITLRFTLFQTIALSFRGKPNKIARRAYRVFWPGPVIAIVGCNGTGKSTMVKLLKEKLEAENLDVLTVYSGRIYFQMLPINWLLRFFTPDTIESKKSTDGQTNVREVRIFHSPILNVIAPFAYYLEYFLRMVKIYPKRVFHDVVLMDRSFIDVFSSPNLNKKVCIVLFHLMPQPKHVLLVNDAAVIAQRRPEFMMKHIQQQLDAYDALPYYVLRVKTDSFEAVNAVAKKVAEWV